MNSNPRCCDEPVLGPQQTQEFLGSINNWSINSAGHLAKTLRFKDFASALSYVNAVGALAEQAGHHPDLALSWGRVSIELWTHSIRGLTGKDFSLASQIDSLG
jgi:4a-hydroxytetrahydrobiopterin dehydratase